ncbi:vWA domain-containing protein [Vagococcus fluvialis]|uniref:vWA domain-containing protein n=1 Tax=Vagococcus fluvialis TaxID=2738 RepID=UPI0037D692E8
MITEQSMEFSELAEKKCEEFITKEQPNLVTFTKDNRLRYVPDLTNETITWNLKQREVYLPATLVLENKESEQIILWHVYYNLALYHEWQKNPESYLLRLERFKKEINEMTTYLYQKIKELGMEKNDLFKPEKLVTYIKKEINTLFFEWDNFYSLVRVFQLCPIYRQPIYQEYIKNYLKVTYFSKKMINQLPTNQLFAKSFLLCMIDSENQIVTNFDKNPYRKKLFGKAYFDFVYQQVVEGINNNSSLEEREDFFRVFIYPEFKVQWQLEIDQMLVQTQTGKEPYKEIEEWLNQEQEKPAEAIEMGADEKQELLETLSEEKEQADVTLKQLLDPKINLEAYGVSKIDQHIYQYYVNETKKIRQEMTLFWEKLIGQAKKEVSTKVNQQLKGKLDINSVIRQYVSLSEAEKIGNYKNLALFNRHILVTQSNILPENIEIIFLVDNSGSMNEVKIDAARKALAATLLSLEDFSHLLKQESITGNQAINLTSATYFFGSHYYQVKNSHTHEKTEIESELIKSISHLNGQEGNTDDASCLKEILELLTSKDEQLLKSGEKIQMIFEITDGAASFPGATKEVIGKLIDKNIILFAFQIGKNSQSTIKKFDYVWNEWIDYERGIKLGEDIDKLTVELLNLVGQQMENIWVNR